MVLSVSLLFDLNMKKLLFKEIKKHLKLFVTTRHANAEWYQIGQNLEKQNELRISILKVQMLEVMRQLTGVQCHFNEYQYHSADQQ